GDTLFEICYDRFSYSYQRSRSVCYSFSTKSPVNEVKYVSSRDFQISGQMYRVYKFLQDDPNIADDEEMFFYLPDLGIIIRNNESWGGSEKLFYASGHAKSQLVVLLENKIMGDKDFFTL
ncbi:hypothetical protein, partial [Reichenbachiella sp. MALMAid0571]|uniref:hypothetical protein n=1 Tax=Reichenbachiella sp. MALMAid0571 TaxID=3143939 RepID=UPI0032DF3091